MKILVTGGTGFIGRATVNRLSAHGHQCIVGSRNPARAASIGLPPGTEFLSDVNQSPPVDAAILLAGESVAGLWTRRKRAAIMSSRVEGTRRVVDWMRTASPRPAVLISPSAVGYFGNRPGEVLDEASPPDPARGFRSRVCLAWEAEAWRAEDLGVRTVVPRFGVVLGPGGGMLRELLRAHRLRFSFVLGNPAAIVPWVALDDVVSAIERALVDAEISGVVNVVAPVKTTNETFTRAVAASVGSHVWGRVPAWLLRAAMGELATAVLDDDYVVPRALLAAGFEFAETDLAAFLARTVRR